MKSFHREPNSKAYAPARPMVKHVHVSWPIVARVRAGKGAMQIFLNLLCRFPNIEKPGSR
jgi:hypothetical protein